MFCQRFEYARKIPADRMFPHVPFCSHGIIPRFYGALGNRFIFIRHYQIRIYFHLFSQSVALGAGAVRRIEREHSRSKFAIRNFAMRAGELLGKQFLFRLFFVICPVRSFSSVMSEGISINIEITSNGVCGYKHQSFG